MMVTSFKLIITKAEDSCKKGGGKPLAADLPESLDIGMGKTYFVQGAKAAFAVLFHGAQKEWSAGSNLRKRRGKGSGKARLCD